MNKQESLFPHISDGQIGAQGKKGFPEHRWLKFGVQNSQPNFRHSKKDSMA